MAMKQILSPLPGTFYRKPAPDQPPYKEEGDSLAVGDVIGLVEVMKSFNEVKADTGGTVAKFLAENEDVRWTADEVLLRLVPGGTVRGRLVLPTSALPTQTSVYLHRQEGGGNVSGTVNEDLSFEIRGVPPGRGNEVKPVIGHSL